MSLVRAFALLSTLSIATLACSQGGDARVDEMGDASFSHETEEANASEAARETLSRLDAQLGEKASSFGTSPVRLRREGAFLAVEAEAPPQAKRANVELPLRARDAFRIADEATKLEAYVSLRGASEARAEVVDESVVYVGGMLGEGDLVHRPSALGTEDFVLFDEAPSSERLEYEVALGEKVAGVRLVENVLEFIDEGGAPRLRVAPPYVIDADGERHDAALSVEGCAVDTNPAGPWGREPVPAGASSCTVVVDWQERGVSYPAVVDPSWETTGAMTVARGRHTASLLSTGQVLATGGLYASSSYSKSAELYDPSSGTWASTGAMAESRAYHSATVLDSKRVLVAGGYYYSNTSGVFGTSYYRDSAQVYDVDSGEWSQAGSLATGRDSHCAVRLEGGRVIVLGGRNGSNSLSSAEIYDPVANTFSSAGNMASRREEADALLLTDGRVFIVGGYNRTANPASWLSSAEIYDPSTDSFANAASIAGARAGHRATLRFDGRVVVYGGYDGSSYLGSGATYNPVNNSWSAVPSSTLRSLATLTALTSGQILVAGGRSTVYPSSAEIYDPLLNQWLTGGPMNRPRSSHTATRLLSGDVLIAGGYDGSSYLSASEIYKSPRLQCADSSHCPSGPCVGGYCCDSACDGGCGSCDLQGYEGTCRPIVAGSSGSPSCSPYVCSGISTACPSSCTSDADCVASHVCKAGACQPKSTNGSACGAASECQSGFCNNGICCDRACGGSCEACTSGTCIFVAAGTPKAGCGYFICNGKSGVCPSSCENDAQCRSDAFCDNGSCQPKVAMGVACQTAGECQSGFCTDGVCCESACGGQCAQCNREGALGSCVPVMGQPLGGRAPCASDGSLCGGSCDGESLDCRYPSASTRCNERHCQDNIASTEAYCDGKGLCAPSESRPCAPYGCGESDCKTACESSSDCHISGECVNGECKGTLDKGQACTAAGECKSGFCADGVCCNAACDEACALCNVAGSVGVCLAQADTSEACQGKSDEEAESDDWLADDGGCGCRVAGEKGTKEGRAFLAGLGLVLAWGARRRRTQSRAS